MYAQQASIARLVGLPVWDDLVEMAQRWPTVSLVSANSTSVTK